MRDPKPIRLDFAYLCPFKDCIKLHSSALSLKMHVAKQHPLDSECPICGSGPFEHTKLHITRSPDPHHILMASTLPGRGSPPHLRQKLRGIITFLRIEDVEAISENSNGIGNYSYFDPTRKAKDLEKAICKIEALIPKQLEARTPIPCLSVLL